MNLATPIEQIHRVGPQYQKRLKRMGIKDVRQLIFHFPHRYDDFSNLIPISKAEEGGPFSFQARIIDIKNIRTKYKRLNLTQAIISDDSGSLKVMWFNQPYLINTLKKNDLLCLSGKIICKKGAKYLSSPAYEKISDPGFQISDLKHTGRLIPVYPETEGLSSKWLRFIVRPILNELKNSISEPLPEKIRKRHNLLPVQKAIWQIHFPDTLASAQEARKRFAFEEIFYISIWVLREKMKLAREKAISIPLKLNIIKDFTKSLPFILTDAQKKASWQILKDIEKSKPMNRLLEGEVGSGKTVVAVLAALNAVKNRYKVAFMAPTEILANQHFQEVSKLLKKFKIKVGLLTGKKKVDITKFDILIGTHALIQDKVKLKKLALVIIDEQHRFGVEQRAKLCKNKDTIPHLLSMTATPIPRTLSLTIYGDLDLSILDELPKGRKKIITKVIPPQKRQETYDFIRKQVKEGRQVFVICPRIEPSSIKNDEQGILNNHSWQDVKAVKEEHEKLSKDIFPDLKISMLHGKMKAEEKEKVMKEFKKKKIHILVSTSVVEVGVDVPNASVMVIEGAERFGLAQLHQFRGRVGRAEHQSFCFLFTDLSGKTINMRLRALITCENGFELAEKDLMIRGAGDFSGARQWGIPDIAMSSLKDTLLVENARKAAKEILQEDPQLKKYPSLKERIAELQRRIHLE